MRVVAEVVTASEELDSLLDRGACEREPAVVRALRLLRRIAVADPVMERISGRDDYGVVREGSEVVDTRKPLGMSARQVRIPLHDLRPGDSAPLRLGFPEVPEADERVVVAPLVPAVDAGALDAPERPAGGILAGRDPRPRLLHLVGERMEHADDDDAIGAAVEAPVNRSRSVMAAIEHACVREDDDASRRERRRDIPLAATLQPFQGSALAQRLVLRAVELVNLVLQPQPVEAHRRAGLNVYAFRAPMPTP